MKLCVRKSALNGQVSIPGSKSHTIRAVALASLAAGRSQIHAPLVSADTAAAVNCYRSLGAVIDTSDNNCWIVDGAAGLLQPPADVIDVGNSGTTLRFAMGSAALLQTGSAVLTGDNQIQRRPLAPLLKSLNDLGASCQSTRDNGAAPVTIRGTLKGGQTSIEAVTSQYLSSLLLCTPLAKGDSVIDVPVLNERPYVEITLRYLDEQGISYENQHFRRFLVPGNQQYHHFSKRVPADFSSATFFLCAAAILQGQLLLRGLDFTDAQGDKAVVDIFRQMGTTIGLEPQGLRVQPGRLKGLDIDLNALPDALPALAVVACFATGPTRLYNVPQARLKETDRIAVMAAELAKLGAHITEQPDGLIIEPATLHAADLCGHDDHRVVMALSLAAMALDGPSNIDTAQAVNVTFPAYVNLMQSVGADMQLLPD